MKFTDKKRYLIGPELFETYSLVLKIGVTIAVIGALIGNTVDWILNDKNIWQYIGTTLITTVNAAIGVFGSITLVFAIMERIAKQKVLEEIRQESAADKLDEVETLPKYFNRIGIIAGVIFTIIFMILINGYMHLLGIYYVSDGITRFISLINVEAFRVYLPYVNGLLILQLLFITSKLVLKKWNYGMATANLVINGLSLILVFAILGDMGIVSADFSSSIDGLMREKGNIGLDPLEMLFRTLKVIFVVIFTADTIEGFYNAYRNSRI